MSCLGNKYNPTPPREWSRVENRCPSTSSTNGLIYIPLLQKYVPENNVIYELQMLVKGNILQYKGNSANLTKNGKYSKIAQGKWVNRNTTWGTQSSSYSNPNTNSLKRVNIKGNVTSEGIPTILPTTECKKPVVPPVKYPTSNSNNINNKPIKPPKPPPKPKYNPHIKPFPPYIPPEPTPIVIHNGGSLICSSSVNTCTGELIKQTYSANCNLTSSSDVPGPITLLCYNGGLPTYYPKNQTTMNNSGNKWPQGVKYLKPA
jgi:hypothetical protein